MLYFKFENNDTFALDREDQVTQLPSGAVPITSEEFQAILATRQVAPTHAELVDSILKQARAERAPIMSVLDGLQASALVNGEIAKAQAIEAAKQGLRDVTALDLSGYSTYEEMRLAFKAHYAQLVAAAPDDVKLAFKQVAG